MKRRIYVMCDQVSGQYGGVFDFANDAECIRSFKNSCAAGVIPEYAIRDTVIVQLAEVDYAGAAPVLEPLMPCIIFYGSEVCRDE